jgi:hypothetical protein
MTLEELEGAKTAVTDRIIEKLRKKTSDGTIPAEVVAVHPGSAKKH